MYNIYNDEITKFSQTQNESLLESLEEYRLNKRKIREYRNMIKMSRWKFNEKKAPNEVRSPYDFYDKNIKNVMERRGWWEQNTIQPFYASKFRFESYNSHSFRCDPKLSKIMRSHSEPRLD